MARAKCLKTELLEALNIRKKAVDIYDILACFEDEGDHSDFEYLCKEGVQIAENIAKTLLDDYDLATCIEQLVGAIAQGGLGFRSMFPEASETILEITRLPMAKRLDVSHLFYTRDRLIKNVAKERRE